MYFVAALLLLAFVVWAELLVIRACYSYLADHVFQGMVQAGMIVGGIGWWDAFVMGIFGTLLSGAVAFSFVGRSK